jgi:hypothetical protein
MQVAGEVLGRVETFKIEVELLGEVGAYVAGWYAWGKGDVHYVAKDVLNNTSDVYAEAYYRVNKMRI